MQDSNRKFLPLGLLLVCLIAAARIALPFYENYRSGAEAKANRFRASDAVLQLMNGANTASPTLDGQFPCVLALVTGSKPQTQLARCKSTSEHSGPVDQFEVDLRYGNFLLRQSDLYLNDVFDVPLTRTYNSGDYLQPNRIHAFGRNANHPYDIAPVGSRYPYTYQMLVLEDGNFIYFPRVSEGTSYSDAVYQHTETSTGFYKAVTGWNGSGWTTWRSDGSLIVFPEAYGAKNAAQGAPVEMRDAAGNRLQLLRDDQRNLQEIRTPHKHSIKFRYDDQSRIIRAQDDQGLWVEYRYDDYGMLTDAIFSSGRQRHYSYQGDLMTAIEDESHNTLLRNSYQGRTLIEQDFGGGEVYSYSYAASSDGSYADSVSVTLPNGTTTRVEVASSVPEAVKHPPN